MNIRKMLADLMVPAFFASNYLFYFIIKKSLTPSKIKGVQQFFCFVTVKDGIIYRFIIFSQRDTLIFTDIFVPVKRRQKKNDDTVQSAFSAQYRHFHGYDDY